MIGRQLALTALTTALLVAGGTHAAATHAATVTHPMNTTLATCTTSLASVELDRQLDTAAITAHPTYAAMYIKAVVNWSRDIGQITAVCSTVCTVAVPGRMPTPAERLTAEDAFAGAIASHVADKAAWPTSTAWDNVWIGRYIALTKFYEAL